MYRSEMCGVFGIRGHPEAANITYLGLHALQHRGQETAGIATTDPEGTTMLRHIGPGLVADVFNAERLAALSGTVAVGHVRYATAGGSAIENAQPLVARGARGTLALAHNGNLVNAEALRQTLELSGAIFSSPGDTEVIAHLLARAQSNDFATRLTEALAQVEGAYALVLAHQGRLFAVRDPNGFRPLVLGRLGDAPVVSSESCALDLIEARYDRAVEPGEIVQIDDAGVRTVSQLTPTPRQCVFEHIYFARPNSTVFGQDVYQARYRLGAELASESPAPADIVIPVPDSGVAAALGYAETAALPFRHGLLRSHYVGRTFIEPEHAIRNFGVKLKLSAVRSVLDKKRVVVVDDSIVRGTTSRKIVKILRDAGAREVHVRIAAPPTKHPCYYGIDTPEAEELISNRLDADGLRQHLRADSVAFVSIPGMHRAIRGLLDVEPTGPGMGHCDACFSGDYPIPIGGHSGRP